MYAVLTSNFLIEGGDGFAVLRDNLISRLPYGNYHLHTSTLLHLVFVVHIADVMSSRCLSFCSWSQGRGRISEINSESFQKLPLMEY